MYIFCRNADSFAVVFCWMHEAKNVRESVRYCHRKLNNLRPNFLIDYFKATQRYWELREFEFQSNIDYQLWKKYPHLVAVLPRAVIQSEWTGKKSQRQVTEDISNLATKIILVVRNRYNTANVTFWSFMVRNYLDLLQQQTVTIHDGFTDQWDYSAASRLWIIPIHALL